MEDSVFICEFFPVKIVLWDKTGNAKKKHCDKKITCLSDLDVLCPIVDLGQLLWGQFCGLQVNENSCEIFVACFL